MGRKHHVQDITTQYGFTLEYVERQETNLDGLRDWYKWNSDDGRFTVCCDDACDDSGRHAIHIFQTGDFKYRTTTPGKSEISLSGVAQMTAA